MNWVRRVIANLGLAPRLPNPETLEAPPESERLHKDAKALLHDLKELRRFEIVVRKR